LKNILYQGFSINDIGKSKVSVLSKRFGCTGIDRAVLSSKDIENRNPDIVIMGVDNTHARHTVAKAMTDGAIDNVIDCRSEGHMVYIRFINGIEGNYDKWVSEIGADDKQGRSCQRESRLSAGKIDAGNSISAAIGLQMLANYLQDDDRTEKDVILAVK